MWVNSTVSQVDEALAKLHELEGLLRERRIDVSVCMEDLVVPVSVGLREADGWKQSRCMATRWTAMTRKTKPASLLDQEKPK